MYVCMYVYEYIMHMWIWYDVIVRKSLIIGTINDATT